MRSSIKLSIAACIAAAGVQLFAGVAANGAIYKNDGGKLSGVVKFSARNKGTYVVSQKQANGSTLDMEVPVRDVSRIEIQEPKEFKQLKSLVDSGKGVSAIAGLAKIVEDYFRMQWDLVAGGYLAKAYMDSNNAAKALEVCQKIVDADPAAGYSGELAPIYWQALIKGGRKATLEKMLNQAASSGDRLTSGAALIARGDSIFEADTPEAARQALVDGYLRVVLMYNDGEVGPQIRPEALYKAAKCFEKIGQTSRANECRTELKARYAGSPWAAR